MFVKSTINAKKKKVIITGASGFIGSNLTKDLNNNNNFSIVPISRFPKNKAILKVTNFKDLPKGNVIIHLAENPNRNEINKENIKHFESNCNHLVKAGFEKIIYISSALVYGVKGKYPYKECSKTFSFDLYSKMKLRNEQIILNSGGIVLRLANVIGFGMSRNNVFSDIIKQRNTNGPIFVKNGNAICDFIDVKDLIDVIEKLIRFNLNGVFNIGSGKPTSIFSLAKTITNFMNNKDRPVNTQDRNQEYSFSVLNIDKIKTKANWYPKISLNQSIKNISGTK